MLSRHKLMGSGFLASLLFTALPVQANVNGSELQNFNAAPSALDDVTVSSGRTLGQGRFSLGIFANTAVNSLPYFREPGEGNRDRQKKINDTVTGVDLQLAYGLLKNWDVSVAMPMIVAQSIREKSDFHGEFERTGITEFRFGTKLGLLSSESLQIAAIGTANYNRTEDNPYVGDVRFPGASLELALSTQLGIVDWSVNVGHRWRESKGDPEIRAQLPIDPAGNQWLASTGVAVDLPRTDVDLIAEVYSAYADSVIAEGSSRKNSIAESIFGFRKPLPYDLQFHAGIGAELSHSQSSADYRAYIGVRWTMDAKPKPKAELATVLPSPEPYFLLPQSNVLDRAADVTLEMDEVYFKFDSTEFRNFRSQATANQLGQALQAQPIDRVVIEGYTCALGTEKYNFDLSEHRAESIERMLVSEYQINPEKLITLGWGELKPKFDNRHEATRKDNRRVTFKIYYQKNIVAQSKATELLSESVPTAPMTLPVVAVPPPTPGPEGQNVAH